MAPATGWMRLSDGPKTLRRPGIGRLPTDTGDRLEIHRAACREVAPPPAAGRFPVKNPVRKETRMMERTLSMIKPDAVQRGLIGEVVLRLEKAGLRIIAMKMIHMSRAQAQGFYAVHRERPFFDSLTDFMSSGPAVVMVLEAENAIAEYRKLMGATNYQEAEEGTIRRAFATDIEKNVVHGSDSPDTAAFEIGYFFNRLEILE
jgi:nucleoside-diphosphate kinase